MRLLKTRLLGKAALSEGAPVDTPEEFKPKEFVEVLKVHNKGLSWRTLSFGKANIKRNVRLMQ
jgi:hypothetical protein